MSDAFVLRLKEPVKWADIELTELRFDEPLVDEIEKSEIGAASGTGQMILLCSLVATRVMGQAIPETAIRRLRQSDFRQAVDFFGRSATPPADGAA